MILQKSFEYADLVLKKYVLLLSQLKIVVLLNINIFVEMVKHFFQDSLINRSIKTAAYIWNWFF